MNHPSSLMNDFNFVPHTNYGEIEIGICLSVLLELMKRYLFRMKRGKVAFDRARTSENCNPPELVHVITYNTNR